MLSYCYLYLSLLLFLLLPWHSKALQFISHTFHFPSISYNTAIYYIHAPSHFIEAHGFALPGFQIKDASVPRKIGDYIVADFFYTTLFERELKHGRVFSERLDTSRVLLDNGKICGHVFIQNTDGKATVQAYGEVLRPKNTWEKVMHRPVTEDKLEHAIRMGYCDFKGHPNLNHYASMLLDRDKKR
jgi:hypothetical protein